MSKYKSATATAPRLLASVCAVVSSLALGNAAAAGNIKLMAGPGGSTWDALSGALKAMIEAEVPDLSVSIRPGGGVSNAKALASGQTEIAWMLALTSVDAIHGRPPFEGPTDNICTLAAFHQSVLHFITTDPEVMDMEDIKGKSVGSLTRGTSSELITQDLLSLSGLTEADLGQYNAATMADLGDMMKDGHISVWVQTSGVPTGVMIDAMTSRSDARLLPISDDLLGKLQAMNSAWHAYTIKANSYPHQEEDVRTAGFATLVGASCTGLSEQDAYEITKAMIKHHADFGAVISEINDITLKDMATDVGIPMHPGAKRAFEEAGVM
jgi:hypothetical protein